MDALPASRLAPCRVSGGYRRRTRHIATPKQTGESQVNNSRMALDGKVAIVTGASSGGLDIAVNNAGVIGPMAATPEVTREAWDQTMATNLTSAFLGAKYQIP